MRLSIAHRTRYAFSESQARLVQLLRMTPSDDRAQTVTAWRIDVDCDARLREGRDGFGNLVTMLYAAGPLDGIELAVSGEVLTQRVESGRVAGAIETLPPAVYRRDTALTRADEALADFAHGIGDDMTALAAAMAERLDVVRAVPEAGVTAADAFARGHAPPRDLAHAMIAAARVLGRPARYVSGHHLPGRNEDDPATAHGWVEVHQGDGWYGYDPALGRAVDDSYVRVAIGLDSTQAAPVAGSRLGAGHEVLDVDVSVERVSAD